MFEKKNKYIVGRKLISLLMAAIAFTPVNAAHARILFVDDVFENDSETFEIGSDDDAATTNLTLRFGGINSETIQWNTAQFNISDDINVTGSVTASDAITANGTLDANGTVTLGDNGDTIAIDSSIWDISSAGVASGFTGITSSGIIDFSSASNIIIPHTDSAILTLDNDNAGAGVDVDIVANQGADNDGIIRYNATTNQWEISNNGGAFAPIASGLTNALAGVQARRTSVFNLTTSMTNVTLDTTDVETTPSILEHNNVNTERIDVKEDGLYMIRYNAAGGGSATSTHLTISRIMKNDSNELPGSRTVNRNYQGEYSSNTANLIAELTANDYITLQLQRDGVTDVTQEDITLSIVKLEGLQGAQGPQGPQGLPGNAGLGTDELSFTLDQDNASTGINVDIIANQGTDPDGILRYNTTDNRWKLSNDGGNFHDIHMASVFAGYDATGGQIINGTEKTLNIDTTIVSDPIYSLNADEVTVSETGLYKINTQITSEDINTTGGARYSTELRIQNNAVDIPGAITYCYHRETTKNSCSLSFVTTLTASDVVRVRFLQVNGNTNAQTRANGSRLFIERIR